MKYNIKLSTVVPALLLGGLCGAFYFVPSHAFSNGRFELVAVGMAETDLRYLLGAPHGERHDALDSTAFFYGGFKRLKWCSMEVYLGADGRDMAKFHDH